MIVGASFDTPEENRGFEQAQELPFILLADSDASVGRTYEVKRPDDEKWADYPLRITYLINPSGEVAKAYEVTDVADHAAAVLEDIKSASPRLEGDAG